MARRSPMNPRYKKDAQVGTTRKSAASAKPKKAASSSSSSSGSSSSKKASTAARTGPIVLPPEIKKLQRYVFGMLGVAVLLSIAYLVWFNKNPGTIGSILIGLSYALLFGALYLDFTKIRPVTKAIRRGELPGGDSGKTDTKGKDA